MGKQKCVFMDYDRKVCRILTETVCSQNRCSFFKTRAEYEKDSERDFLHESYAKGAITEQRYSYLLRLYHKGKKKSS